MMLRPYEPCTLDIETGSAKGQPEVHETLETNKKAIACLCETALLPLWESVRCVIVYRPLADLTDFLSWLWNDCVLSW